MHCFLASESTQLNAVHEPICCKPVSGRLQPYTVVGGFCFSCYVSGEVGISQRIVCDTVLALRDHQLPALNDFHQSVCTGKRYRLPACTNCAFDIVVSVVGKEDFTWVAIDELGCFLIDASVWFHALDFV